MRGCTDAELKKAYLRAAKAYHPDMNPGDKAAVRRFQRISEAYEMLSNPVRRSQFDTSGTWSKEASSGGRDWHATWGDFVKDRGVILEVVQLYIETVREEALLAGELAWQGKWTQAWGVAREHRGLMMAIAGLFVIVRFPAAVFVALRLLAAGLLHPNTLRVLYNLGLDERFPLWVWSRLVQAAHGQRQHLQQRAAAREQAAEQRSKEQRKSSGARMRRG